MSKITRGSSSLGLHRSTTEANAVAWSQDQRISVTAAEAIYVLTLKRPKLSSLTKNEDAGSPDPEIDHYDSNPLLTINTAPAPLKEKLAPLDLGDVSRGGMSTYPRAAKWNMMDFVDPMLSSNRDGSSQSHDLFKASYWTPAGYSHLGGCVLTALTTSGRVLLFTPPGNTGNCWKMALDISFHHTSLLLAGKVQEKEPQPTPISTTTTTTKRQRSSSRGESSKKDDVASADDANQSRESSVSSAVDETPRPKRAKLVSKTGLSEEFFMRRLSVACTVCAWLPTLLLVNREVIGVVAIATRTGHVTLLGVKLPIVMGKISSDPVSLLCDYQLPLSCDEREGWGCSLRWLPSFTATSLTTPTFYTSPAPEGHVHSQLLVGCTSGEVFSLKWKLSGVDGVVGLVSSSVSSVNGITGVCSISGVAGVKGCVSEVTRIWEKEDDIPVYTIACQSKVSADDELLWVVFSKSSLLVAAKLDTNYKLIGEHIKISGHHKMTISGIAAFSDSFISSALDGTVQMFSLNANTEDDHVTPNPITVEIKGSKKGITAQGVAVSEMGLFAAVSINPSKNGQVKTTKKLQMQSQLHFLTIATSNQVEALLQKEASSKWDICEFMRKHYLQHQSLLPPVQHLQALKSKGRVIPVPDLQFLLQINIMTGKRESSIQCKEEIIRRHVFDSLKSWQEREKDWKSPVTIQEGDFQSLLCLHLMTQWLLSGAQRHTANETKLANKVLNTLPPLPPFSPSSSSGQKYSEKPNKSSKSSSSSDKSESSGPLEHCQACGEPVPLTSLHQDSCSNGHTWSRCSLTLCLAVDARCSSCIQCGAIVNNALTINAEAGSWLNSLLQRHSCCIYCGGYFEQVI